MEALVLVIGRSYWVNNEETDCMKHAAGRIKEESGDRGARWNLHYSEPPATAQIL